MKALGTIFALLATTMAASPAWAAVTVTLRAAAGTDLNNIRVGDTFGIDAVLGGSAGEFYTGLQNGTLTYSPSLTLLSSTFGPNRRTQDLASGPVLLAYRFQAQVAGAAPFSFAYTGLSTNTAIYNGNANGLTVTVLPVTAPVPEPATWAMMLVGFGMIGFGLRRRTSSVRTTVRFA